METPQGSPALQSRDVHLAGLNDIGNTISKYPIRISTPRRSILSLSASRVVSKYRQNRSPKSLDKNKGTNFRINCRCQPKCVLNIIKDFDDQKKDLVQQIGFKGIFDLKITKVNRQFGAWLLSKVDPKKCAIVPDNNKVIPFSCNDVNVVLGLPCIGKYINPCSSEEVERNKTILCEIFEVPYFSKVTVTFLEGILKKKYADPMTFDEKRSIKAAFVLYVMTKLFAPQSLANNISTRYIGAVADVDNIINYNWSQFVVEDLKKCAELMPKSFLKSSQGSINGCILFLQLLYLDNLDFCEDELPNHTYPRISAFHDENVGRMIQADTVCKNNTGYPFPQYGKIKLRDAPRAIYTSLPDERANEHGSSTGTLFSRQSNDSYISQFVKRRFKSKKNSAIIGTEAQGLINEAVTNAYGEFSLILEDISDFVNICDNKTAGEALQRFRKVIDETTLYVLRIAVKATLHNVIGINEETNGDHSNTNQSSAKESQNSVCSTQGLHAHRNCSAMDIEAPSFDLGITQTIDRSQAYCTNPLARGNGSPIPISIKEINNMPESTPTKMLPYLGSSNNQTTSISPGSGTRMSNQCKILLIQEFGNEDCKRRKYTVENPPSHLLKEKTKRTIKPSKKLMSPFLTKHCPLERHDARMADALYSYITSASDTASLSEIWLKSSYPFRISLTLRNLQETLSMNGRMDSDCLNFAIRSLYRTEVERFKNMNYIGWRHFINQDFGMYAVAGEEFWEPTHQLAHFTGPEIVYNVANCHMILIPVHLFNHYTLYVFNMENKKISVLDSLNARGPLGESRATRHDKICISVTDALMQCMRLASPGWDEDLEAWDFEIVENIPEQHNGVDCGFFVFDYMWNWDGQRLVNPISEDSYELRKQFMLHLLTFKDNEATLPDYIRQQLSLTMNKNSRY